MARLVNSYETIDRAQANCLLIVPVWESALVWENAPVLENAPV